MDAVLKVWRQIENPTMRAEHSAQFIPDPIWNGGPLDCFEDDRPNKKNKKKKLMMISSDFRSVPGLKAR